MIFLALQTFSKKTAGAVKLRSCRWVRPVCFCSVRRRVQIREVSVLPRGQMVRDIDLDRHVLIAMDGRILHGNNAFSL